MIASNLIVEVKHFFLPLKRCLNRDFPTKEAINFNAAAR